MLLIITNQEDIHPSPVIDILAERKSPFFRLNTENLFTHYNFVYEISDDRDYFEISYKDGSHSINSDEISCVWERRPCEPLATYDSFENEQISKTLLEEGESFLKFFRYSLDNLPWIGDAVRERKAGSKILQKKIAKKVGLSIPPTLFTNTLLSVENFRTKSIAVKPIAAHGLENDKQNSIYFYTLLKSKEEIVNLGEIGIRNTMNFFEAYTEKDFEIRSTFIIDEFFTAKIESQSCTTDTGKIDWRQGYDHGIKFTKFNMSEEIEEKCKKFLDYFGLTFGCFDFIVDKLGNYHFLECNTNGQWMWLEEEAGINISAKLAEYFCEIIDNHKID
jgi:hypothetical protein